MKLCVIFARVNTKRDVGVLQTDWVKLDEWPVSDWKELQQRNVVAIE